MKKENRYLVKIAILLLLIISVNYLVLSNRGVSNNILDKDNLVIGMELKFPPFETVDNKGEPMGVSVELANRLGEKLNKNIEIKNIEYAGLIPALQSNSIDLIISSMTITEERLKSIDFSDEYAKSSLALALNNKVDVESYEDLNSQEYTIAVKQGNLAEMWAGKYLENAKIKQFSEVSAALLDVNNGYSDAFIYDPLSLIEGTTTLSNVKLLLEPLPDVKGWGIGMNKGNEELRSLINQALKEIKEEGFYEEMREKYLKEDVEKYESYGLDYLF